jgi:hypothetical protein
MSPIQSLAVGIRLFSIWLLWYGLTHVSSTYFTARGADHETLLPPFAIGAILVVAICALLWLFPVFLAKRILPKQSEEEKAKPVFEDWFSVGCSLLGVWAISKAIPALGSYLIINYLGQKMYPGSFNVAPDWPLHVTFNVFQLLFGLWLFLGATGIKKILTWVREA